MSKVIDNLEAHRQERNEEMELLRGQVDEIDELRRNNDLLETHCKTLNYQLEVEKNEARERYIDRLYRLRCNTMKPAYIFVIGFLQQLVT